MNDQLREAQSDSLVPFLKWAGGKRWLPKTYSEHFPQSFARYYEPFLGGGAVFLALRPQRGQLSDSNVELINSYKAIKRDWRAVRTSLRSHARAHSDEHYYAVRASTPKESVGRAARFLYLNRTCWNGLYRVNLKGTFNVPRGTKDAVILPTDDFAEISRRLRGIVLTCCDFEVALDGVARNDFVYIDPPYTVKHNINGFLKYNEKIFSWEDQERLAKCIRRMASRGAKILVSQADHSSVRDLYKGIGIQHTVIRSSVIAAASDRRCLVSELLIRINY